MKQIISLAAQLGTVLQAARKSAHLSQTDLAQRLGMSQPRISAMELNPGSINVEQLLTLCSALNLEITVQVRPSAGQGDAPTKSEW